MAALGHEQTSERDRATTAIHPKKDTLRFTAQVCQVPQAEIKVEAATL